MNDVYIPRNAGKIKKQKRAKYGNKRVKYQGRWYQSIKERDRYIFLQQEQRQGRIRDLRCQVSFSFDIKGIHICKYIADFTYNKKEAIGVDFEGYTEFKFGVVEDVKSDATITALFKAKKQLMLICHDIDVKIVMNVTEEV